MVRPWVRVTVVFAAWTMICLLVTTQTYLGARPDSAGLSWSSLVVLRLAYWWMWALVTLGIIRLSRWLPIERGRWLPPLIAHVFLASVVAVLMVAYFMFLLRLDPLPDRGVDPFREDFLLGLGLFFHFDFLIYFGVLGIGHTLSYYDRFRERSLEAAHLAQRLAEAQLEALRLQIQPHFLFNTLHAISSLMDEDVVGARRMVARLGDLLRLTLEKGKKQEISLAEELEIVEQYLAIEQIRFQDRLTVEQVISREALDCQVPSLLLQPLAENAVRHGVEPLEKGGRVRLQAVVEAGRLELEVADEGPGLEGAESQLQRAGIGLSNVRARLQHLYGAEGFELKMENRASGGLRVMVSLPARRLAGEGRRKP
ncbi:MAG: sensor histidine kinase [Deltaproteobacteria bacterium]|nr:sensor histidine kinase [Deltaproteobacteria bacterium]